MNFDNILSGAREMLGNIFAPKLISPLPDVKFTVNPRSNGLISPAADSPAPTPTMAQAQAMLPTPTPRPSQGGAWTQPDEPTLDSIKNYRINYAPYLKNSERLKARFNTEDPNQLPQPSPEQLKEILQYFPEDATRAAIVRLTEDRLNDNPPDYTGNNDGTVDAGTWMNNSGTFEEMWNRNAGTPEKPRYIMRERMQNRGINSFDDLKNNLELAIRMASLTANPNSRPGENRWGAYAPPAPNAPLGVNKVGPWFGPSDAGFDLSQKLD